MKSPITGNEMVLKKELKKLKFRKEEFTYNYHFYFCVDSGETFTTTELDELNITQVYNKYRAKHNIPFTDEIIKLRELYALSAKKMAEILGFGTNVYRNYENGEIPSNSNGKIIQLAMVPENFKTMVNLSDSIDETQREKIFNTIRELSVDESKIFKARFKEYLLGSKLPDMNSGYTKPSLRKLSEMVKFFAEKQKPYTTVLNKLLFYSDFLKYKKTGFSMSGIRYSAIPMGPVPNNYRSIYEYMNNDRLVTIETIRFPNGNSGSKFTKNENQVFNQDLFTELELEILEKVNSIFSSMSTKDVVEFSHREKAWIENKDNKSLIDYNLAFEITQI